MKKSKLLVIISSVLIFSISYMKVNAVTNTYPHKDATHCGCQADEWGFYKRQCTSYAAWKANESGVAFSNGMNGGWFGNAGNWDDNASYAGFTVSTSPNVGSIAVWEANSGGAGAAGHVAWVEEVNNDNTVDISEYNWNYGNGEFNQRYNRTADKYIHLIGSSGGSCTGTNPLIQNVNITTSYSCVSSGTITIAPTTNIGPGSNQASFVSQ